MSDWTSAHWGPSWVWRQTLPWMAISVGTSGSEPGPTGPTGDTGTGNGTGDTGDTGDTGTG